MPVSVELLRPVEHESTTCTRCGLSTRFYAYIHAVTGRWLPCSDGHDEHEPA